MYKLNTNHMYTYTKMSFPVSIQLFDLVESILQLKMLSYILNETNYIGGTDYKHHGRRVDDFLRTYSAPRKRQIEVIKELVKLGLLVRIDAGIYQINPELIGSLSIE